MANKVLIGMSGGVDSSVAALLLKEQGYEVVGATMKLWDNPADTTVSDSKAVCDSIGIEHVVLDFRCEFKKYVTEEFMTEYTLGRTPNPCVTCNKYLKFGKFFEYAMENGFDHIATGHYAKVVEKDGLYRLMISSAEDKDQSYMLYNLGQKELARILFPLAEYSKDRVRDKAREAEIPVADKSESMEICFIPDNDYANYIVNNLDYTPTEGDILDVNGGVIGRHRGLIYYTVGQRKGIGAYGRPMFVKRIDPQNNTIILGEKGMEYDGGLVAERISFISGEMPTEAFKTTAKIRYKAKPEPCCVEPIGDGRVKVIFDAPQRAITPGQSVVFYNGDELIGGGVIEGAV